MVGQAPPDRQRPAEPAPTVEELALGVPDGVLELAGRRWRQAEESAERAGLRAPSHDDAWLTDRLRHELAAPRRLEDWPAPTEPEPVAGGWIHSDVIDEDRAVLDAILADRGRSGPEVVALACQELRLPVTPYRSLGATVIAEDAPPLLPAGAGRARPGGTGPPVVVDLSTHWAGPLATALLAEAGAEVIKIDPSCRQDGFRSRPALYHHLNGAKQVLDLDLRLADDRERFETLLVGADLLVESFSRRVMPNLGYGPADLRRCNPDLGVVSITSFPASSPEADWLAYGPGVHAASGLGLTTGRALPSPIAYPDLVAGVTAWAGAAAVLAAGGGFAEVSLAGSIAPLLQQATPASDQDRTGRG